MAVLTDDLDRFVAFYRDVFDVDVVFSEDSPAFRHAILRAGPDLVDPSRRGRSAANTGPTPPTMFDRGHLDHVAIGAASPAAFDELLPRLVTRGASDGTVEDLGAFHSLWFRDPDGMQAELTLVVDDTLAGIHAPRPMPSS